MAMLIRSMAMTQGPAIFMYFIVLLLSLGIGFSTYCSFLSVLDKFP
jgi:hypothetical protein